MNQTIPKSITVNKKTRELNVSWNDGHTSNYSFSLLRHGCPCAECRGGHEKMSTEPPPEAFYLPIEDTQATHLVKLEEVGSYGICLEWEDGHNHGIYDWHYLRAMCSCPICQEMMIYGK